MAKRSHSGGTMALVIVLIFVIILVGTGFFIWTKIIGGGNELQQATDSGNLNVAKQVLIQPSVAAITIPSVSDAVGNSISASNVFGGLVDPNSVPAYQFDLVTYDRLVGQSVLVTLNAAAEGTPSASTNAIALVTLQNNVGSALQTQLSTATNLSGFFSKLAGANTTRMLQNNNKISANQNETAVSYMARSKAANVFISSNQIPTAEQSFITNPANIASKVIGNVTVNYLAGYTPLQCGIPSVTPIAVPMRPGEQPHLVNLSDFEGSVTPPSSNIPPNAFLSGGSSLAGNATGLNLDMRSSAIVGTLTQNFPVSIPWGYIEVDNSGNVIETSNVGGGGPSALASQMMKPNSIELFPTSSGNVFGPPGSVQAIYNYVNNPSNSPPVPPVLLSAIDQPSPAVFNSGNYYAAMQGSTWAKNSAECTNMNSFNDSTSPNPSCVNAYAQFVSYYGSTTGSSETDTLMSVEAFKCNVLNTRASVGTTITSTGASGCGTVTTPPCTGLKNYNISSQYCWDTNNSCDFSSPGTLSQLLGISGSTAATATPASSLGNYTLAPYGDLVTRMYQIAPEGDVSSILNTVVPFGSISYIYQQPNASGQPQLVLGSAPPGLLPPGSVPPAPDGTQVTYSTPQVNLNGTIINVPTCDGYPNPFDCPAVPATGQNSVYWTPSSGHNNLLGVLKFTNCSFGGGTFCCPC